MGEVGKTVIILGATGLTGGILLQDLLEDNRYRKIKVFSRSSVGFQHPKLEEHLGNLLEMETFGKLFTAHEVFCCIGTTKAKTPDARLYRKIDYGIPVNAAQLCKENGIDTYLVISALGANSESSIFYNKIKGEMEQAVLGVGISKTHILQPSLIGGNRGEKRLGEWLFKQVMGLLDPLLLGRFGKYRIIDPKAIAKCMVWLANHDIDTKRIASNEIRTLAEKGNLTRG